ncbi:exodeoxyribonuclease III/group II intron reverse transcriptase/maturase,TIGR04416 [Lachnospiraceae bacterium XBB1006]|nr:exodeoxyribonuclease III/group II intron reverse transcriptase/maturase,TIGR04416 [Lachnospiraceae bacterium XBB1006]
MRIISWNINGARRLLRSCRLNELLWMWQADIFAFQETKLVQPDHRLMLPGYHAYWSFPTTAGNTTSPQSGTVCFCRRKPIAVYTSFPANDFDTEGRLLTLEYEHFYFVNCYTPNTQDAVDRRNAAKSVERREYRARWDRRFREYVCELDRKKPVIISGDFNAAISSIDMEQGSRWQDGEESFAKDENDQLRQLTAAGFADTYRILHPKEKRAYTHWSVRDKNRKTSPGRRLDYCFVSGDLKDKVQDANIYQDIYGSDHCPVYLKINTSQPVLRNERTVNLTYEDMLERERTGVFFYSLKDADLSNAWNTVDWSRAEEHLAIMQAKIARAAEENNLDFLKNLQYQLVASLDAKLLAVRAVTSRKASPGVDGIVWETANEKMHAAIELTSKDYNAKPARLIEKEDKKGKNRRFHVDTYYDRAMQTLYGYSLAPVAESWADRKSFSNRRCRCTMDANYFISKIYSGEDAPKWAFKTDIQKCYESISHEWIRDNIPLARRVLDEFLNAGYFLSDKYYEMDRGIGVGSRLSPYLANMAMDGLQDYIYYRLNPGVDEDKIDYDNGHVVRYADDFLISARDQHTAYMIGTYFRDFMAERGLTPATDKTEIIYVPNGFDFLRRSYKRYGNNMVASPSEAAITSFQNSVIELITDYAGSIPSLFEELNRKIVGFASYHKMTDASVAFREIDATIALSLTKLSRKRFAGMTENERLHKLWYVDEKGRHVFAPKEANEKRILFMSDTIFTEYKPLPLDVNPYIAYERVAQLKANREIQNVTGDYKRIWARQEGCCEICRREFRQDEEKELFEMHPSEKSFIDRMAYIHSRCKDCVIEYVDYKDSEYQEVNKAKVLMAELSEEYALLNVQNNPLYQFFKTTDKKTVSLSFKKIEEYYGGSLPEEATEHMYWVMYADVGMRRCWLDNDFYVRSVGGKGKTRKQVVFHKYQFSGNTVSFHVPDILLNGKVPERFGHHLEAILKHEFEANGYPW